MAASTGFLAFLELCSRSMPATGDAPSIQHFFEQTRDEMKTSNSVNVVFVFTVAGERKLVAVLESKEARSLEEFCHSLQRISSDFEFTISPLRPYETFANTILGIDDPFCKPSPRKFSSDKNLLWMELDIGYQGLSMDELKKVWRQEGTVALMKRQEGLEIELFKVVGQNKLHIFLIKTNEELDMMTFVLPLWQALGNQLTVKVKPLLFLKENAANLTQQKCV